MNTAQRVGSNRIIATLTLATIVPMMAQTTEEGAIKQLITAMTDGMNKHDAKAIAKLYTPDGDLVNIFGVRWKGPAEIENGMKTHFAAELRNATFKTVDVTIRFVRPDVAIADVINEVSGIVGPNGQAVPSNRERSMRVFIKNNGRWLLTAFHNTAINSPGR